MKLLRLSFATIFIVCQSVQVLEGANNDAKESKWFLFNQDLFYIDTQQKFVSREAQQYCVDSKMDNIIRSEELVGLAKLLIRNFEYGSCCWVLDENFSSDTSNNKSLSECYALGIRGIYSEPCSVWRGVICKQVIYGGSLQYKNGTHVDVGVGDVNQYCHPQAKEYDEQLQYCLLKLNTSEL